MKSKTYIFLLVLLFILSVTTYFLSYQNKQSWHSTRMGENLFKNFQANNVSRITIKNPSSFVELAKDQSKWVVANRLNYPADFSMIIDLVKKIKGIKVGRSFNSSPDIISRLALKSPESNDIQKNQRGIRVLLEDSSNKALVDIILGKPREDSPGTGAHYIMISRDKKVYLVDRSFKFIAEKKHEWLKKNILEISPEDISTIICIEYNTNKIKYSLIRDAKGKEPGFMNMPENKKTVKPILNQAFAAISALRLYNIVDSKLSNNHKQFSQPKIFEYHLFNGIVYTIYIGSATKEDNDKNYLNVKVKYLTLNEKNKSKSFVNGKKTKNSSLKKQEKSFAQQADDLNKKLSKFTYIVSKWELDNFIDNPDKFLEPVK